MKHLAFVVVACLWSGFAAAEEANRDAQALEAATLDALVGEWEGTYAYPKADLDGKPIDRAPVKFTLVFSKKDGELTGRIKEPNTFGKEGDPWLHAEVDAVAVDAKGVVIFHKQYDGTAEVSHGVFYGGRLSADKTTLTGSWWIPADWAGTFVMTKK